MISKQQKWLTCIDGLKICPSDLFCEEQNGFNDGIVNSGFCWRWKSRGKENFRILTIEGNHINKSLKEQQIIPLNLYSTDPKFTDDIVKTHFNWRNIQMDNGQSFKAVTIENSKQQYQSNGELFRPSDFVFDDDIKPEQYIFNWRWFKRGNEDFRLVTLE